MKTSPITWAIIRILTRRGKRHVKELRSNCTRTGEELKVNIVDYCVYPNRDISPSHYEFLIEPERQLDPARCGEYLEILERHLGEVNPVYKEELDTNEIDHGVLFLQQEQTHALWCELRIQKGASLNQVKPVRVLDTPIKKNFFYKLREM